MAAGVLPGLLHHIPGRFLIHEREWWERSAKQPLQKALNMAPKAFCWLGVGGLLATAIFLMSR